MLLDQVKRGEPCTSEGARSTRLARAAEARRVRAGPSRYYSFGHQTESHRAHIVICPSCNRPSFLAPGLREQVPGPLVGRRLDKITDEDVLSLYVEAQKALAAGAPSASVMVCRKLLMHVAVQHGAEENASFSVYAQYLIDEAIVGKPFFEVVQHIRKQGNRENHDLEVRSQEDAETILRLVEFVLSSIYELPSMVPDSRSASTEE